MRGKTAQRVKAPAACRRGAIEWAYHNRANAYADKGDLDRAMADNDRALALDPKRASVYYNRALAHKVRGTFDRAVEDYTHAIDLKPDDALAYYNRANIYLNKSCLLYTSDAAD